MRSRHLTVLLAAVAVVLALRCQQILDVDVFWQVRNGQLMLETGRPLDRDVYTYTHAGMPVPPVGWLAQVAMALVYRAGGWEAVQAGAALVVAGALAVGAWMGGPPGASPFAVVVAMWLGLLVGFTNADPRPQVVALLGLALLLAVVRGGLGPWIKIALAVPLVLVWQNAHPSLSVGVAAVGALTVAGWIAALRRPGASRPWNLTILLLLVIAAQFATPMGLDVVRVSRVNLMVARDWLHGREWLPPWDPRVAGRVASFWLVLAFTGALLPRVWRGVWLAELALVAVLTAVALSAARFALVWGVVMVPIWARWIDLVQPRTLFAWSGDDRVSRPVAVALLVVAGGLAAVVPGLVRGPVLSPLLPIEGVRRLAAALPAGRVFNHREWGGPLILEGAPRWRVTIDGRLYLFLRREEWLELAAAAAGRIPLDALEQAHRPDAFFLEPTTHAPLIALLERSDRWRTLYRDGTCHVFIRRDR